METTVSPSQPEITVQEGIAKPRQVSTTSTNQNDLCLSLPINPVKHEPRAIHIQIPVQS